jgi:hypothetical protein
MLWLELNVKNDRYYPIPTKSCDIIKIGTKIKKASMADCVPDENIYKDLEELCIRR